MAGPGFSTPGTYTPLQLIAGAGLLNNQGIQVPTSLSNAVSSYNSTSFVQSLTATIAAAPGFGISANVVTSLKTLGSSTCPALGASVPASYAGANPLLPASEPGGFGNLVANNAAMYLGDGSIDQFCQIFQIVTGFRKTANDLICSAVNASTYLGPTFTTMNNLITGQLTAVNLALKCFGADLAKSGNLINLSKLNNFGTPGGLLEQISDEGKIPSGTLSCIAEKLYEAGLTESDIILLATPAASNRQITENEYNALQKKAYQAFTQINGDCLTYVLDILDAVIPGIDTLADLLDLQKIFPTSWPSMTVPDTTPDGPPGATILIFEPDGSVNPVIQSALNDSAAIVLPAGCDELAKILPPDQALANKTFQASLQQVGGISSTTTPQLAVALLG